MEAEDELYSKDEYATEQEVILFWNASIAASAVTTVSSFYMLWKCCTDPVYKQPTLRASVPILAGSLGFLMILISMVLNYQQRREFFGQGPTSLTIACTMPHLGFGLTYVSWQGLILTALTPLQLVRSARKFQVLRLPWTLVTAVLIFGWVFGLGGVAFLYMVFGSHSYRGLACFPKIWGREACWFVSSSLSGPVMMTFALFHIAGKELEALGANVHVGRLRRKAAAIKRYSLMSLANQLLWTMPFALYNVLEGLLGIKFRVTTVIALMTIFLLQGFGNSVLIWFHARSLRKKQVWGRADLETTFKPTKNRSAIVDTSDVGNRAVSIHFLHWFASEYGVDNKMTVTEVMTELVRAPTQNRKTSYCEHIKDLQDSAGRPAVARANYFVSHAWNDTFLRLLEQLTRFYRHKGGKGEDGTSNTVYFWIDIFAINQHEGGVADDLAKMPSVIQSSDAVLLTLNPWNAPQTLTRVWCLWEVLQAVEHQREIVPVMPGCEEVHFMKTMQRNEREKILEVLATINVQNANATVASDKDKIFEQISKSVGFDRMNDLLKVNLEGCLQGIAVDRAVLGTAQIETIKLPGSDDFDITRSNTSEIS